LYNKTVQKAKPKAGFVRAECHEFLALYSHPVREVPEISVALVIRNRKTLRLRQSFCQTFYTRVRRFRWGEYCEKNADTLSRPLNFVVKRFD